MENKISSETACESKVIKNERLACQESIESNQSLDQSSIDWRQTLVDYPNIIEFIETLQSKIKNQSAKLKKLKSKLKHSKKSKKRKCHNVFTQTEADVQSKTISEEIIEAAQSALETNGFVYEATSGMYYDYNTGYYYNDELRLYYDGNTGIYYDYNAETKQYLYHSTAEVTPNPIVNNKRKKKSKPKQVKKRLRNETIDEIISKTSTLEDGECSNSSYDSDESLNDSDCSSSSVTQNYSDIAKAYPPCMRIIITETAIPTSKPGTLFIITYEGGTLGREGDHSMILQDINISKHHLKFTFDKDSNKYFVTDLGSRNGTILNGKRISSAKQESEALEIVHGSVIQVGNTKLLCHVHQGNETCGHCEPGLFQHVQIEPEKREIIVQPNKEILHKTELKRLKKKFGIDPHDETNNKLAKGYSDRARTRRDKVGSSVDHGKTEVASLDQSISSDNKGFKLLSKMGWTEGQSLGKDGTGVTEPIPIQSNAGTSGLGSREMIKNPAENTANSVPERKQVLWRKTQQRYQQLPATSLPAFDVSNEDET